MILDSSFLIDIMEDVSAANELAIKMDVEELVQRVPVQSVQELYYGVGYSNQSFDEVDKIQAVVESRPIVETTLEIAKLAGRMEGTLDREGEQLPSGDVVIGATARHFGEPVVTADVEHFERMPAVEVRTY
jgi:predicted nucleic acid-binding protein